MSETELPHLPETPGVTYKPVPGFPGYIAGDDGSLWSAIIPSKKRRLYGSEWRKKKCWQSRDGYWMCSLRGLDKKDARVAVHSVILSTFVGPRPKGYDALHGNGIPSDNRLVNLRWGTRKENMEDARRHGTLARRERNGHAKLSSLKTKAISELRKLGWSQHDIADVLGVSQPTISAVENGHRWTDDPEHESGLPYQMVSEA